MLNNDDTSSVTINSDVTSSVTRTSSDSQVCLPSSLFTSHSHALFQWFSTCCKRTIRGTLKFANWCGNIFTFIIERLFYTHFDVKFYADKKRRTTVLLLSIYLTFFQFYCYSILFSHRKVSNRKNGNKKFANELIVRSFALQRSLGTVQIILDRLGQ